MNIAIIGGGLAGSALAYVFARLGDTVRLYEAGPTLASGASGNFSGLYNPRLSVLRGAESDFYTAAYFQALRTFKKLGDIDWRPNGVLHLLETDKKEQRYRRTVQNWAWPADHMHIVDAAEASDIAGIPLRYGALYLPKGGSVTPQKLCAAYTQNAEIHLNRPVEKLEDIDADVKILACGPAVHKFAPYLPMIPVRGQVTQVKATPISAELKCNISCNGYLMPAVKGVHNLGATFQPDLSHCNLIDADNQENIERLVDVIPELGTELVVVGQRASVRATSRQRFPIIGRAPGEENIYFSAAHGSYGILSSLMGAHLLADMIKDRPRCLPSPVIKALSPERLLKKQ